MKQTHYKNTNILNDIFLNNNKSSNGMICYNNHNKCNNKRNNNTCYNNTYSIYSNYNSLKTLTDKLLKASIKMFKSGIDFINDSIEFKTIDFSNLENGNSENRTPKNKNLSKEILGNKKPFNYTKLLERIIKFKLAELNLSSNVLRLSNIIIMESL